MQYVTFCIWLLSPIIMFLRSLPFLKYSSIILNQYSLVSSVWTLMRRITHMDGQLLSVPVSYCAISLGWWVRLWWAAFHAEENSLTWLHHHFLTHSTAKVYLGHLGWDYYKQNCSGHSCMCLLGICANFLGWISSSGITRSPPLFKDGSHICFPTGSNWQFWGPVVNV